jgi:hypothetical protein
VRVFKRGKLDARNESPIFKQTKTINKTLHVYILEHGVSPAPDALAYPAGHAEQVYLLGCVCVHVVSASHGCDAHVSITARSESMWIKTTDIVNVRCKSKTLQYLMLVCHHKHAKMEEEG